MAAPQPASRPAKPATVSTALKTNGRPQQPYNGPNRDICGCGQALPHLGRCWRPEPVRTVTWWGPANRN